MNRLLIDFSLHICYSIQRGDIFMNNIGDRLREARISKGLTQNQLAERLHCSDKAISRYEKNTNLEKVYDFIKVCEILEVDINYITTGKKYYCGKEITEEDNQVLVSYYNLSDSDRRIVDFVLGVGEFDTSKIIKFPELQSKVDYVYVCQQKASAGIGEIEDESNSELKLICFEDGIVPAGTTHGIVINGNSMEDKFFDKQIVFIQRGLVCAPSDYGIFSVTDDDGTQIYCKQLMQREDGSKYLHSLNSNVGDPDINYESVIDIHCVGKILI